MIDDLLRASGCKWVPIPNTQSKYLISENGDIFSVKSGCRLKPYIEKYSGYVRATIKRAGDRRQKKYPVHRLVLEAFVGKCPDGLACRHLNGVRTDNRLSNLKWDTYKTNEADKYIQGTACVGERHWSAKLTVPQVIEIKSLSTGRNASVLAKKYGVNRSTIQRVVNGSSWSYALRDIEAILRGEK